MKHPTIFKVLLLVIITLLLSFQPCQSQGIVDHHHARPVKVSEVLIFRDIETLKVLRFKYSSYTNAYEMTCKSIGPIPEDIGFLSVFISFDDDEDYFYLPHSEEDMRTLRKRGSSLTYNLDSEGKIKVSISHPQGGTPWSTIDADLLTLRVYRTELDLRPFLEQGLNLEDEFVFEILRREHVENDMTRW